MYNLNKRLRSSVLPFHPSPFHTKILLYHTYSIELRYTLIEKIRNDFETSLITVLKSLIVFLRVSRFDRSSSWLQLSQDATKSLWYKVRTVVLLRILV